MRRRLLERLGDPVGFQQHLGGGGDQRPAGLERGDRLGPEPGLPRLGQSEQVGGGPVRAGSSSTCRSSARSTARNVSTSPIASGSNSTWARANSLLDLVRGGDVAVPGVPPHPPGPGQADAGVHAGRRAWRRPSPRTGRRARSRRSPAIRSVSQDVAGQPRRAGRAAARRGAARCRRRARGCRPARRRRTSSRPRRRAGRRGGRPGRRPGGCRSRRGARRRPCVISGHVAAEGVEVGQGQLARLDLLLDLGGVIVAQEGLQGVAGDDREPGVAGGRLLAGLHDDPGDLQLDEGVAGVRLVERDVDDQPGRLRALPGAGRSRAGGGRSCRRSGRRSPRGGPGPPASSP